MVRTTSTPYSWRVLRSFGVTVLTVAVIGGLWQLAIVAFRPPDFIVPAPATVALAFEQHYQVLLSSAVVTVGAAALGILLSTAFAIVLSVVFLASRTASDIAMPLVIAFRSAPVVAIAPIIMLFVGRGIGTSVIVVLIISFFPLLVNLMKGFAAADRGCVELMRVYGASRIQQLRFIRIPYALPFFFAGLRVAGPQALLGAMLSEWITGAHGIGYLILSAGSLREVELLWAAVLLSVAIALIVFWSTSAGDRALLHWRR
jgi:NitT/TauT family transport system permease protein